MTLASIGGRSGLSSLIFSLAAMVGVSAGVANAYDGPTSVDAHVVARGPLKVEVPLEGLITSEHIKEVAINPKSWADFAVLEAIEHGAKVREGDVIVRFDDKKLEESIGDLEAAQHLAKLAIDEAEEDFPLVEHQLKKELEAAERAYKNAKQDDELYREVQKPLQTKNIEFQVLMANKRMEYAEEELRQLEKMYESDDLTEETEKLMLRRQRDSLEAAKLQHEQFKISVRNTVEIEIPRSEEAKRDNLENLRRNLDRAKTNRLRTLSAKRFALERQKVQYERSQEQLDKLRADRDLMVVKAPVDGVAYFGRHVSGSWPEIAAMMTKMRKGGRIGPGEVLVSIVQPGSLSVRCAVPERIITQVHPSKVQITAAAYPHDRVSGRITDVTPIQVATGQYTANIELDDAPEGVALAPGMACKVNVTAFAKKDALWIPATAIQNDEWDGEQFVLVLTKDGDKEVQQRRSVKLGQRTDSKVEVLEGLAVGDRIKRGAQ